MTDTPPAHTHPDDTSVESVATLERAGILLGRFALLDDDEAAELHHIITGHQSLAALVDAGVNSTGDPAAHRVYTLLASRLTAGGHAPELATLLDVPTDDVDQHLDHVSDRINTGRLDEAETLLADLYAGIAEAVLARGDGPAGLAAAGLIELFAGDPVWQHANGPS